MVAVIRMAQPQDLPALEKIENDADALFIELFRPPRWWSASSGQERAAAPGFILVVVEEDDLPAGFVHVVEMDGFAHLEQLSVTPSRARRGHGRALVEAAKEEGARRGYTEMTLRTYKDVPWNAPFYTQLGFHPSVAVTAFHWRVLAVELDLELDQYGPRVQMTASLPR